MENHKISRNDPCPCGSGLKFKKCCYGKPPKPKFSAKVLKSGKQHEQGVDLMQRFTQIHQPKEKAFELTEHDFRVQSKEDSQAAQ